MRLVMSELPAGVHISNKEVAVQPNCHTQCWKRGFLSEHAWARVTTSHHESPRVTTSHREWPRVKKRKILGWILWEMLKEQELWGWPTFRKGNYFAVLTTIDSSESSSSPDTWSMGSVSYICSFHMLLVKMAFLRGKWLLKVSQIWCFWFKNEFIIIGNFLR